MWGQAGREQIVTVFPKLVRVDVPATDISAPESGRILMSSEHVQRSCQPLLVIDLSLCLEQI